jgi:hypothetical protein
MSLTASRSMNPKSFAKRYCKFNLGSVIEVTINATTSGATSWKILFLVYNRGRKILESKDV